jgi:hypothetical protein
LRSKDVSRRITLSSLGVVLSQRYKNKKRRWNVTHVRVFNSSQCFTAKNTIYILLQKCFDAKSVERNLATLNLFVVYVRALEHRAFFDILVQ